MLPTITSKRFNKVTMEFQLYEMVVITQFSFTKAIYSVATNVLVVKIDTRVMLA